MKFDGSVTSTQIINNLSASGTFATFLVGKDKASEIYTNLKKQAAEKIGMELIVKSFAEDENILNIKEELIRLNADANIKGIMIQLPLPEKLKIYTKELIDLIDESKDIDGMREDSKFTPATVRGILNVLEIAKAKGRIAVVGAKGTVGRALVKSLRSTDYREFDLGDDLSKLVNFDVVISATGQSNLIKPEMIKQDAVLIDVGAPKAEFSEECYAKASFYTPVPGGVGPMTIASLMQNMAEAI